VDSSALVSVVIPFFNRQRTLARAIDSVIAQTYANWELILVDDGSDDGSAEVARKYQQLHPGRIRVLRQENAGPGVARNTGIGAARGAFVGILDSDDQWKPTFVEAVMAAFAAAPEIDWIYVNVQRMDEDGRVLVPSVFDDDRSEPFRALATRRIGQLEAIDDPAFLETAILATVKEGANTIVRRKVFDVVKYHPVLRFGEDRVLTISAIAAGIRFGYIDQVLMTKFHHGGNVSVFDDAKTDKALRAQADLIRGLEHVRRVIPLGARERGALRKRLSAFYFEYARLLLEGRRGYVAPLAYIVKAVMIEPSRNPVFGALGRRLRLRASG
jgi:glycosyltransferase involved in cell wall biosynthesis